MWALLFSIYGYFLYQKSMQNQDRSTKFSCQSQQLETLSFYNCLPMQSHPISQQSLQKSLSDEIANSGSSPYDKLVVIESITSFCERLFFTMEIFRRKRGIHHKELFLYQEDFIWRYSAMDFEGQFHKIMKAAFLLIKYLKLTHDESIQQMRRIIHNNIFRALPNENFNQITSIMEWEVLKDTMFVGAPENRTNRHQGSNSRSQSLNHLSQRSGSHVAPNIQSSFINNLFGPSQRNSGRLQKSKATANLNLKKKK